ncbi:LexA family protein [Microvirga sp. P5_D2]
MITGLTRKQNQLFRYISGYIDSQGIAPTLDEMKDAMGVKSKSCIHRTLTSLENRGWVRREKNLARALIVEDAAKARARRAGAA